MTDERDRRRRPHRNYGGQTPPAGVPVSRSVSGEMDSDDARMAEHFEDDTPVEVLKRIERKLSSEKVHVDPHAFDADTRWEAFAEMQREVAACKAERLSREKRAKFIDPLRKVSVGGLVVALLWCVRALDQRGADSERGRARDRQVERNTGDIRDLQDWQIKIDTLLGLRARLFPEPDRSDP